MTRSIVVALATLVASALALPGHPPPTPEMLNALRVVEASCSKDLSAFCPLPQEQFKRTFPVLRLGAPRDPFMEFLANPSATTPPMHDISSVLGQMMSQAMLMSNDEPYITVYSFVRIGDDSVQTEETPTVMQGKAAAEEVLESMVDSLVQRSPENPEVLAKKIVDHANDLLRTEKDEDRVRLARRLTELSPDKFRGPHLSLPFGCQRNRCLMSAFQQGVLSSPCSEALKAAENLQNDHVMREFVRVERDSELFISFTILYSVLAFVTLFVLSKRLRKMHKVMESHVHLKRKILQAVYSNPSIKSKVEESIGSGIGFVPPLPPHALAELGGHKFPHGRFFCFKMIMLASFAGVFTLVFVNPLLAMPILCILMFARFVRLAFYPPQQPEPMCSCCCCGLSTDDVKNGNISATQACCTCCNSMGVCAPGCADCCGFNPDGACDCCMDGCDCCNKDAECCSKGGDTSADNNASLTKPLLRADKGIFQGIPIQVV